MGNALGDGLCTSSPQLLQTAYIFLAYGSLLRHKGSHRSTLLCHSTYVFYWFNAQALAKPLTPRGNLLLYSWLAHRVSSCWPVCIIAAWCLVVDPEPVHPAPVKHAFKSSQWHWEQRLAQLGFRRAWIPCHLSHSWRNSALKCSTCSNQSFLLAVKALSPELGHSCTSSCHLSCAAMPSSTFQGACDYTDPTQILRRDNLTALRESDWRTYLLLSFPWEQVLSCSIYPPTSTYSVPLHQPLPALPGQWERVAMQHQTWRSQAATIYPSLFYIRPKRGNLSQSVTVPLILSLPWESQVVKQGRNARVGMGENSPGFATYFLHRLCLSLMFQSISSGLF